jgi:hypothetical protein
MLAWCDRAGGVWTMALATLQPQRVDVDGEKVDHLAAFGDSFVLAGDRSTFLLTHDGVRTISAGHARQLAFSPTGKLAAIIDDFAGPLKIVEFGPSGGVASTTEYRDAYVIQWLDDVLWVGSERGLGTRTSLETQVRGGIHQLIEGPGGSLIARTRNSAFMLFDEKVIVEIPPTYAIHDLATGPKSDFVVAGSDYVVLAWTLDDVRPRTLPLRAPSSMMYAGADQMIVIHDNAHGTWVELATLVRTPIDLPGAAHTIEFAPDGSSALVITAAHSAVLYQRGVPGSTLLGTGVSAAAFATPSEIVIGTESGVVRAIDLAGKPVREVDRGASQVDAIEIRGAWLVAQFRDGQLVRMRLDGGQRVALPADGKLHWFELFESGEFAHTDFTQLSVLHPDGTSTPYPGLPTPVSAVEAIGPDSFIVYTGGDSAHLVELGGQRRVAAAYPPGMRMEWLRFEGDHGVYLSPDASLFETAPRTGVSWRVATQRRERFIGPTLSRDRTKLFVLAGDRLLVWTHVLPKNATETTTLFDRLTNARPADAESVARPGYAGPRSSAEGGAESINAASPTLRLRWD